MFHCTVCFFFQNNQSFMRKIPPKAEASNILIGEVECLEKVVSCFIRLNESCKLGDLTEVPVPTRFIFVLLGPTGQGMKYHEIGRAMATLLSDDVSFYFILLPSNERVSFRTFVFYMDLSYTVVVN